MIINTGDISAHTANFRKYWRKNNHQKPIKYEDLPEDFRLWVEGKLEINQVKNPDEFYKAEDGFWYTTPHVLF